MPSEREEIESEIAAHVGSWLDVAYEKYEPGFAIKSFAVIFETEFPPEEEGGFPDSQIGFTSSDNRGWIKSAMFRRAMLIAESEVYEGGYEAEDEAEAGDS